MVWKYPFAYTTGDDGNMAVDVPTETSIRVQFDRFLEPLSAVRATLCVESASPGTGGCAGGANGRPIAVEYDPVDRVAVWKNVALAPNLLYNARIVAPKDANDSNGIRAFDGVPLEQDYVFSFRTGAGPAPTATWSEPNRSGINFCSKSQYCALPDTCSGTSPFPDSRFTGPETLLRESCANSGSGCHSTPSKRPSGVAGSALVLNDKDGGVPGAVNRLVLNGVVATETAVGPEPGKARGSEKDLFGVNMPYIHAKYPGNSFLLYKVLLAMPPRCSQPNEESANPEYLRACKSDGGFDLEGFTAKQYPCSSITCMPDAAPILSPEAGAPADEGQRVPPIVPSWVPGARWKPPAEGEYNRLRRRIRGDSMVAGSPMPYQQVIALSAWIAAGATTDCQ